MRYSTCISDKGDSGNRMMGNLKVRKVDELKVSLKRKLATLYLLFLVSESIK